jgi:hypothetical protein
VFRPRPRPRPRVEVVSTCPAAAASRAQPAATSRRARIPLQAAQRAPLADIARALAAPAPARAQAAKAAGPLLWVLLRVHCQAPQHNKPSLPLWPV